MPQAPRFSSASGVVPAATLSLVYAQVGSARSPCTRYPALCSTPTDRDRQTASDPHAASGFPVSSTICLASPLVGSRHPHQQQQPLPSASDAPQCSAAEPKTCTTPPLPPSTVRSHPYNHPPPPPALLPSPPKRRWGGHRRRGTLKIRTGSGPGKSSGTTPAPGTCQWPTRRP